MPVMDNVPFPKHLCMAFAFFIAACAFMGGAVALAQSGDYYADVVLDVRENGDVEISGISNHPDLSGRVSPDFTSKDRGYWLLNVSFDGVFSEYVFEVRFPEGAVLNYIRLPNRLSMGEDDGRIVVTSTGMNDSFYVVAQYSLGSDSDGKGGMQGLPTVSYVAGMVVLVLAIYILFVAFFRRAGDKDGIFGGVKDYFLTERQRQIVSALRKNKGAMTQAELQKELGIPKASLSRNIDALVMKDIVAKESKGMTNVIALKDAKA